MDTIEIGTSRVKYFFLSLIAIGFVMASTFLLGRPGVTLAAWLCIIIFGSMLPVFIWQIIDSHPRLILDDEGLMDRSLPIGKIHWRDIRGAYIQEINGNDFIFLDLKNAERYLKKLSPAMREALNLNEQSFTPLSLNLNGTRSDATELLGIVLKMSVGGQAR